MAAKQRQNEDRVISKRIINLRVLNGNSKEANVQLQKFSIQALIRTELCSSSREIRMVNVRA